MSEVTAKGATLLNGGAVHPLERSRSPDRRPLFSSSLQTPAWSIFHTPDGDSFAAVSSNGHIETHALASKGFRTFLRNRYFERTNGALASKGLQDAIGYLDSLALRGPEIEVFTRVGWHGDSFFLDLCNAEWSAVEITREGWFINPRPPVRFRRSGSMLSLPNPVSGDPDAESNFRKCINFRDEEQLILIKM